MAAIWGAEGITIEIQMLTLEHPCPYRQSLGNQSYYLQFNGTYTILTKL
jgi:hypothetical protein